MRLKNNQREFNLSLAQVINEKENKKMPDESSLNEKLSDLVGSSSYKLNNNFSLNYDFSLDQIILNLIITKLDQKLM